MAETIQLEATQDQRAEFVQMLRAVGLARRNPRLSIGKVSLEMTEGF